MSMFLSTRTEPPAERVQPFPSPSLAGSNIREPTEQMMGDSKSMCLIASPTQANSLDIGVAGADGNRSFLHLQLASGTQPSFGEF